MLKSVLMSQRDKYEQRIDTLQQFISRAKRESQHTANYRRTIALYRDLIAVIEKHDVPHSTSPHGTTRHNTTPHNTLQHNTTQHGTTRHRTA